MAERDFQLKSILLLLFTINKSSPVMKRCMCAYICVCVCIHMSGYVCTWVCACINTYTWAFICVHISVCTYECVCVYIYESVCVCIHTFIEVELIISCFYYISMNGLRKYHPTGFLKIIYWLLVLQHIHCTSV